MTASDLPAVTDGENGADGERPRRRRRRDRDGALEVAPEAGGESTSEAREPRADREHREPRGDREPRAERTFLPDDAYATLFVSIGKRDNVRVVDLLRLFETQAGLGKDTLGRIRIRDRHAFVSVPKERAEEAITKLNGFDHQGRALQVEVAKAEREGEAPSAQAEGSEA